MLGSGQLERSKTRRRCPVASLRQDSYITDGRRLFRCIFGEEGPMLMLEDCLTLELILCSLTELAEAEMQIVKAPA
jgi:hypothetical protein